MKRILILTSMIIMAFSTNTFASEAINEIVYTASLPLLMTVPEAWAELFKEVDIIIGGILATATLTSFLAFIIHALKLASMPSHPIARRDVMFGVLWSGVILACIGAVDIIFVVIYTTIMG